MKKNKVEKVIRLNKFISNSGLCTRRDADNLIKSKKVFVNGKVIDKLGSKVLENDIVKVITNKNTFKCKKAFSSIMKPISYNKKYPLLKQHFIGWFIKTEKNIFNDDKNKVDKGEKRNFHFAACSSTEFRPIKKEIPADIFSQSRG